jgi:general secretion pathway protein I
LCSTTNQHTFLLMPYMLSRQQKNDGRIELAVIMKSNHRAYNHMVDFFYEETGFTILEVIVALVLLSSVGMAAFSWMNTSLMSVERITRVNEQTEMVLNGLELLRRLNPMTQPAGELETDSFHLSWQAKEYHAPVKQKYGIYSIAVYNVSGVVRPINSRERFEFSFLQNGYQPQVNP